MNKVKVCCAGPPVFALDLAHGIKLAKRPDQVHTFALVLARWTLLIALLVARQ